MLINNNYQKYFQNTKFVKSIFELKHLPIDTCKEIAIVGRSNCGKSSIINSITNQKKLATTSKSPGRTQAINYFEISAKKYLVDLPGYGYAKVATTTKLSWQPLIEKYLQTRKSLTGIILVMDIRHPLKPEDQQMLLFCKHYNIATKIVLNKADQLSIAKSNAIQQSFIPKLQSLGTPSEVQIFSAIQKIGIVELRNTILNYLQLLN